MSACFSVLPSDVRQHCVPGVREGRDVRDAGHRHEVGRRGGDGVQGQHHCRGSGRGLDDQRAA